MAQHMPCPYCAALPPLDRARKGTMHRCALCKGEILESASGSFRLRTEDGEIIAVGGRSRWPRWTVPILAAAFLTVAIGVWVRLQSTTPQKIDAAPVARDRATENAPSEPLAPPEWVGIAKANYPGVFFLAKPAAPLKGAIQHHGVSGVVPAVKGGAAAPADIKTGPNAASLAGS